MKEIRSELVAFRLTPYEEERLDWMCTQLGKGRSKVIRHALDNLENKLYKGHVGSGSSQSRQKV